MCMCGSCQVLQNILEAESEYSRELQSLLGSYLRSLHPTDRWSYFYTFYCLFSQIFVVEVHTCLAISNAIPVYTRWMLFTVSDFTYSLLQNALHMIYYPTTVSEIGRYIDWFITAFLWKCVIHFDWITYKHELI